jgi:aldose 1-epimerase
VITLQDGPATVTINPAFGNNASSMVINGCEFIWKPEPWQAPALGGIPLLAPWANRIGGESYLANGARYLLNPALGNLRYDGNHLPIHGLLLFASGWRIVQQKPAEVTSRLAFWRHPKWMAQFPFAHAIEMTHRLTGSTLEVETAVENLSTEPLPLCIGYHPFFQLTDSPRDTWKVRIPARKQVVLSEKVLPTGELLPAQPHYPFPLDAVFTRLTGEPFAIEGARQRLRVRFGPKYPVAIVYAPPDRPFICIEPMTALTNAFNTETATLQHIAPGATWRESFWIDVEL